MQGIDVLVVAVAVSCAVVYLIKVFWPQRRPGSACGCVDCKVPKPKLRVTEVDAQNFKE